MSNSVFKQGIGYTFQDEDKKIIDTNQLVASKLEVLAEIMEKQAARSSSFSGEFTEGLEAMQVQQLLSDTDEDGQELGNVIKAEPFDDPAAYEAAHSSAQEIIDNAQAEAESIIAQAQADAESLREQAINEGRQLGYDDGFAEGSTQAFKQIEDREAQLLEKSAFLDSQYEQKVSELEPLFIDTLTEVYEHIFHVNLSDSKDIIFYLIQDAVRKVESNKNFIIHVSKEDYGFVSMQKTELLAGIAGGDTAEIVEDMTLRANECYIETGGGIFDCSLETQLAGLKRELRLLSFVKE